MVYHLIDFSLQLHSPSASQIPLVCPRVTQLAVQAHSPREHLKPPMVRLIMVTRTTMMERVYLAMSNLYDCTAMTVTLVGGITAYAIRQGSGAQKAGNPGIKKGFPNL